MYVTIIGAKIFYGASTNAVDQQITDYLKNGHRASSIAGLVPINRQYANMTDDQFVRFKNAGRRHASSTPGKKVGQIDRTRPDRSSSYSLEKWDVDHYGSLTGRTGPWGNRSLTNRDHMTADSSNQLRNKGLPANAAESPSSVKRSGLAITVSGNHHRSASYTYGGRTKSPSPISGFNRTEYGAYYPTDAFQTEMNSMLAWKANHSNKNTLRLEMVGAYTYMYKKAVDLQVISASMAQDLELIGWIRAAVQNDDGKVRK